LILRLEAVSGGQRPPLQSLICKTTLKLQIHAVATGVDRRKYIFSCLSPKKIKNNKSFLDFIELKAYLCPQPEI